MFFHLLQLLINPTAALMAIHNSHQGYVKTRFFSKKLLFVSKPECFEEIFSHEAKGMISRDSLHDVKKPMFGDGLFNSHRETWTKQRRLMQPLFTKQAVAVWQDIMRDEAICAVRRIQQADSTDVNMSFELKTIIQKVLIRVMFGYEKPGRGDKQLMAAIDQIMQGLFPHMLMEVLGKAKLKPLFVLRNRRMSQAIGHFISYVEKEIDGNKSKDPDNYLMSMLIRSKDSGTTYVMSKQLLKDEAVTLFLAGQDTTVNALVWFFYLIGKHPAEQQRIRDEINQYAADALTTENLEKLLYTKAALYETLRLYPQAIALARDTTEAVTLHGQNVAANTSIIMNVFAAHRDSKHWQHPDAFYPEHFLNNALIDRHKNAFLPFGGGMHNCIGRHFAELEMMLVITTLMREFAFKTQKDVKPAVSMTFKPARDVILSVTPVAID